ncbi:MAG: hypothetical protein C4321_05780 [Chloroflexota bacterium]
MITLDDLRTNPGQFLGTTDDAGDENSSRVFAAIERLMSAGMAEDEAISVVLPSRGKVDWIAIQAILGQRAWIPTFWLISDMPQQGMRCGIPVMVEHVMEQWFCFSAQDWVEGIEPPPAIIASDGILEYRGSRAHPYRLVPIIFRKD